MCRQVRHTDSKSSPGLIDSYVPLGCSPAPSDLHLLARKAVFPSLCPRLLPDAVTKSRPKPALGREAFGSLVTVIH